MEIGRVCGERKEQLGERRRGRLVVRGKVGAYRQCGNEVC